MREIRLYGSEGGGAVCSPYPYPGWSGRSCARFVPEMINFPQLPLLRGNFIEPALEMK